MSVAMEDWQRRHRITVDEYHRMAESGSFAPDARVELIDGEIIDMPPIGSAHAAMVCQLDDLLRPAVSSRAMVRCQLPIQLGVTTLQDDLRKKMALYARHGIQEYWVVDVTNHRVHVFRQPSGAGYEQASCIDHPGTLAIAALPGASVDLSRASEGAGSPRALSCGL